MKKKSLEESYSDFLIYKNDREHPTIKVDHFRVIMNYEIKILFIRSKRTRLKEEDISNVFFRKQYWKSI